MKTIEQAYVNALLADATYVDVNPEMDIGKLIDALSKRMTPTLAAYIAANFEVASSVNESDVPIFGSGFDATVWRGKDDGDFAGQVFVSMRGTEPPPVAAGADLLADVVDVAVSAGAVGQFVDMVNWWLRETAAENTDAPQITIAKGARLDFTNEICYARRHAPTSPNSPSRFAAAHCATWT